MHVNFSVGTAGNAYVAGGVAEIDAGVAGDGVGSFKAAADAGAAGATAGQRQNRA